MRAWRVAAAVVLLALPLPRSDPPDLPPRNPPNVVLIITDDQRFDSLFSMPHVLSLAAHGVTFSRGIVPNTLCCPSRASILTGGYSHTTHVYTNHYGPWSPFGGWRAFREAGDERGTIALALHGAGYRTALFGKYLNNFFGSVVPPGWDRFSAFFGNHEYGDYYDYRMLVGDREGAEAKAYGSTANDYSTTVIANDALAFLRSTPGSEPFLLYVAPFAPHMLAVPAARDVGSFADHRQVLRPSFNEADVSDKPPYLRGRPFLPESEVRERFQLEYETLQAVDRMVGRIVGELQRSGRLQDTAIIFMSDNGEEFGEHRWDYKLAPYEESLRVPIIVRFDPMTQSRSGSVSNALVSTVDVAPTIADIAGVPFDGVGTVDGVSIAPLLTGASRAVRSSVLLEHIDFPGRFHIPSYCGLRTRGWVYVRYLDGFVELYRLSSDPYELRNIAKTATEQRARLHAETRALCRPLPPGFHW